MRQDTMQVHDGQVPEESLIDASSEVLPPLPVLSIASQIAQKIKSFDNEYAHFKLRSDLIEELWAQHGRN